MNIKDIFRCIIHNDKYKIISFEELAALEREFREREAYLRILENSEMGENTREETILFNAFKKLDEGIDDVAEKEFRKLFGAHPGKKKPRTIRVGVYDTRSVKRVYVIADDFCEQNFKENWVIKQYESREEAALELAVNSIRRLNGKTAGTFYVERGVIGPDLFNVYSLLEDDDFSFRIKKELIDETLDQVLSIQSEKLCLEGERSVPDYSRKIVESLRFLDLDDELMKRINYWGGLLEQDSVVNFKDAAPWNFLLDIKRLASVFSLKSRTFRKLIDEAKDLIEHGALDKEVFYSELRKSVYAVDFSTINRRTFPSDDFDHAILMPGVVSDRDEYLRIEREFANRSPHRIEFFRNRELKTAYRQLRLRQLYSEDRIPARFGDHESFHTKELFNALYRNAMNDRSLEYSATRDFKGLRDLIMAIETND